MKNYLYFSAATFILAGTIQCQATILKSNGNLFIVNPTNGQVHALVNPDGLSPVSSKNVLVKGDVLQAKSGNLYTVNPIDGQMHALINPDGLSPINVKGITISP